MADDDEIDDEKTLFNVPAPTERTPTTQPSMRRERERRDTTQLMVTEHGQALAIQAMADTLRAEWRRGVGFVTTWLLLLTMAVAFVAAFVLLAVAR